MGTRPEVPGAGQQQLLHRLAVPYHPGKRRLQGTPGQLLHLGRRSALPGARTGGPYPAQRQPETARQLHLHRHHLHQVAGRQPGPYAEPGAQAHGFAVGRLCLRRRPAQRSEHRRRRSLRRRDLGGQGKHLAGAGLHPGRRADRLRPRQDRPERPGRQPQCQQPAGQGLRGVLLQPGLLLLRREAQRHRDGELPVLTVHPGPGASAAVPASSPARNVRAGHSPASPAVPWLPGAPCAPSWSCCTAMSVWLPRCSFSSPVSPAACWHSIMKSTNG